MYLVFLSDHMLTGVCHVLEEHICHILGGRLACFNETKPELQACTETESISVQLSSHFRLEIPDC